MAYVISDPCVDVKDAACVEVCPVDCIKSTDDDRAYYINPEECIDCAACEPVCPVTAIFAESALPGAAQQWAKINADWHKGDKAGVRAAINKIKPK